ncbi:Hint domain-containing protein [Palleronia rufa]|uniref:Hint domain-containing protein n=1 Tax=Palleronia rufa TaxID=1530186 RepID=UPI00055B831B|nr:Hint domain-containing protein [Palleronia rufa]
MSIAGFEFGALQSLAVYPAAAFAVVDGAHMGDPISIAGELVEGDVYHLSPNAVRVPLNVTIRPDAPGFRVARKCPTGQSGAVLHIDCCVTLMSPDGTTLEALILVELDRITQDISRIHLFALAEISPRTDYAIVEIDTARGWSRFAEFCCVSFTRRARIAMACGAQVAVEDLREGDRVLTRDHGVQPIRWIGHRTVRAVGDFAPVRIRAGALGNLGDLLVSPNHRVHVADDDRSDAGTGGALSRARDLLDGRSVVQTGGGFVDYFQMLFERHVVVYAEGIPVETLLLDQATRFAFPDGIFRRFGPGHGHRPDVADAEADRIHSASAGPGDRAAVL